MTRPLRTIVAALGTAAVLLSPIAGTGTWFGPEAAFAKGSKGGENGGGNGKGGENGNKGGNQKSGGNSDKTKEKSNNSNSNGGKQKDKKEPVATASLDEGAAGKPGKGRIASELKGLNAVHASAGAMERASPNSQVGRIAAYRDAALATNDAGELVAARQLDLDEAMLAEAAALLDLENLAPYEGRPLQDVDADIAALDPLSETFAEEREALSAERRALLEYEAAVEELTGAAEDATAGRIEAEEALADAKAFADGAGVAEAEALSVAARGRELSPEALTYLRERLGL